MGNFKLYDENKKHNGPKPLGVRRPCQRCEAMFYRSGRYQKLCEPCIIKATTGPNNRLRKWWADRKKNEKT